MHETAFLFSRLSVGVESHHNRHMDLGLSGGWFHRVAGNITGTPGPLLRDDLNSYVSFRSYDTCN